MNKFWFLKTVLEDFKDLTMRQAQKGYDKYGKAMDYKDSYDWLEMASEEMADGVQYLYAEKMRRDEVIKSVNVTVDTLLTLKPELDGATKLLLHSIKNDMAYLAGKENRR